MTGKRIIQRLWFGLIVFLLVATMGCNPKNINMLQTNIDVIKASNQTPPELTIQRGDLLFIGITSRDPQSDIRYNINNYYAMGNQANASTGSLLGHLVDNNGVIKLPDIGEVKVEGMKTDELAAYLRAKLETYLKEPIVTVRFLNFRISVLGEVARPGTFQVPTEKISIIEALGLAGDVTVYGEREKVMVIREVNGKREYGWIDLTKGDLFNSPYFYLQQNDAIYVYVNDRKVANTDQTTVRNVSLAIGIVSTIAIVITALRR